MVVRRGTAVRWVAPLFWMAAIFFMSHQPKLAIIDLGGWDLLVKKGGHMAAYAVLFWLFWRAMQGWSRPDAWAFLFTLAYAISDEFHQSFVPGRHGMAIDVIIDGLGGLAAMGVVIWLGRRRPFRWPAKSQSGQKALTDAP
ncbi:MAG: VanZ family protein [Anaerolineae bacterium]